MKTSIVAIAFLVTALLVSAASAGFYPLDHGITSYVTSDTTAKNVEGVIAVQTIAAAETSDDDQIATGVPANNTTAINLTTFTAQPDVARNIIVTPSGAATGTVRINGTNIAGATLTENLTLSGTGVVASTAAFKTVTKVEGDFTQETARTLKIGTGDLLGLNTKLTTNTVLFCALNGTREATAPSVTVSATTLSLNTIDTSTVPGGKITKIWFVV